jgi:RNA polymerase sigma factor (sigma-70 family)
MQDCLDSPSLDNTPQAACGLSVVVLEALIRQHHQHLIKFIYRRVHNLEHAQDIAQATYIEALRGAANFKGQSQPKTWLFGIAVNLSKNRQYHAFAHENIDEMGHIACYSLNPEETVHQNQTLNRVVHVLRALSQDLQKTAYLVLCLNTSYELTAQTLNIPIGTVRSRVARVRQMLKHADLMAA